MGMASGWKWCMKNSQIIAYIVDTWVMNNTIAL